MFQKNKQVILISLMICLVSAQPAHGNPSWFSSFFCSVQRMFTSTLSIAQEYKKASVAITCLTLGTSLVSIFAWHIKKQHKIKSEALEDHTYEQKMQEAQEKRFKLETAQHEMNLKKIADSLAVKEKQLLSLDESIASKQKEKALIDGHAAQKMTLAKLIIENNQLDSNLAQARANRKAIIKLSALNNVHKNLDYWLEFSSKSSATAGAPIHTKDQKDTEHDTK